MFDGHSSGYTAAPLINRATGSVHTGLSIDQLAPGGTVDPHVHSFEEGFYILSGEAILTIGSESYRLRPGDYAAIKVGTPHAWWRRRSPGALAADGGAAAQAGRRRARHLLRQGSLGPTSAAARSRRSAATCSATSTSARFRRWRAAERASGLEGVFLKWLIDEEFGAAHHRLLFIEYQPGVGIGLHDHTFEEAYFILSGEVEATLDGKVYDLKPGDVVWTGVGCVHAFGNVSSGAGALARDVCAAAAERERVPLHGGMGPKRASWRVGHHDTHRPDAAVHRRRNTSRASATDARSGSTASASRTSPRTRRSATPCG